MKKSVPAKAILQFLILVFTGGTALFSHAGDYAQTRYPIVLVGGSFINFDRLGPIEFFYRIPNELKKQGADVYVSTVSAVNSPEVRGEQLAQQVEEIVAITGKPKVNLISISSGGLTARYAASAYPDLIASVTTINAGHSGTPIADIAYQLVGALPDTWDQIIWETGNTITGFLALLAGDVLSMDTEQLAYYHTHQGALSFNRQYPEGRPTTYCGQGPELAENGVRYFAFAGSHWFTNWLDPTDFIWGITRLAMNEKSDGVFGRCSSHWGNTLRDDLRLNHLDEANHLFGITSPRLNPVMLYLQQANRLKNLDL